MEGETDKMVILVRGEGEAIRLNRLAPFEIATAEGNSRGLDWRTVWYDCQIY